MPRSEKTQGGFILFSLLVLVVLGGFLIFDSLWWHGLQFDYARFGLQFLDPYVNHFYWGLAFLTAGWIGLGLLRW